MALPSWLIRETERNARHSRVSVFAGPDADHRALAGTLVLNHDEADDLFSALGRDSNRFTIERASRDDAKPTWPSSSRT